MTEEPSSVVSAEVVLVPASGREPDAPPSAATLAEHAAAPADAERARSWFAERGFQVGPPAPRSFSITGPADVFRDVLGARLEVGADPGRPSVRSVGTGGGSRALPLDAVPPDVAAVIREVAFAPPPDFGPPRP